MRWPRPPSGLIWAAGALAIGGVELDLFAVFAVVTFVGIGVDYGIHLVHRYQERGDAERATAELAPVILVAAAITLLGYGTLVNLVVSAAALDRRGVRGERRHAGAGIGAGAARDAGQRALTMTLRSAAVIPAFNEGNTIAAVVEGVRGFVDRVIVVDDGSRDGTAERARAAGADVIVHDGNRGKGHAVRSGLRRVFEQDFTHVLLLDGDMQHLPAEAAALLAEAA